MKKALRRLKRRGLIWLLRDLPHDPPSGIVMKVCERGGTLDIDSLIRSQAVKSLLPRKVTYGGATP